MNENENKLLKCLEESLEAVKLNDIAKMEELKSELTSLFDSVINESNNSKHILDNSSCFGVIHKIFEHNAPYLFNSNNGRRIIGKYIKTIKNDEILKEEFSFYSQIMSCQDKATRMSIIDDALNVKKNFPKDKILESNKKLFDIIKVNNLATNIEISDDVLNVLKSIGTLYETKKNMRNLSKIAESKSIICDYENRVSNKMESVLNIDDVVLESLESFNDKYKKELNEGEKNIISVICNTNNINEKKSLFNDSKEELVNEISRIINEEETSDEIKEKLTILKEKVSSKEFNEKTLVTDMIELYDISNILE